MGWIKRKIRGLLLPILGKKGGKKLLKKLGKNAPLVGSGIIVAAFIANVFGSIGLSDALMQGFVWLDAPTLIKPEMLVALQSAVEPIVNALIELFAPLAVGTGVALKVKAVVADKKGKLSKPPVLTNFQKHLLEQTPSGKDMARISESWRAKMNSGMNSDAAFREARRNVLGG